MFKYCSKIILRLWGWKIQNAIPPGTKKAVIIGGPHTSMYDFIIGRFAYGEIGISPRFLIKKEMFFWPLGCILKALGGIPVDRGKRTNMVDKVAELFDDKDSFYVVITPEGTRKPTSRWKKGFYYIALKAKVPIAIGYIDYAKKEGGIGKLMIPSGDFDKDIIEIKSFYLDKTAKYPEMFVTGLEDK